MPREVQPAPSHVSSYRGVTPLSSNQMEDRNTSRLPPNEKCPLVFDISVCVLTVKYCDESKENVENAFAGIGVDKLMTYR
jgi:hypothetical protein